MGTVMKTVTKKNENVKTVFLKKEEPLVSISKQYGFHVFVCFADSFHTVPIRFHSFLLQRTEIKEAR